MKKHYSTPECLVSLIADEDILTTSGGYTEVNKDGGENGEFDENSAVIKW